jgi:hypothetical protein
MSEPLDAAGIGVDEITCGKVRQDASPAMVLS